MPFTTVRLTPGVKSEVTPALNEAGISSSNLIRFRAGLPEKIGGWSLYYNGSLNGPARALCGWVDLNDVSHLAIGQGTSLTVLTSGFAQDISPQNIATNNPVSFSTTVGSDIVTIIDFGSNCSIYDAAYLATPVSVGGLVLYGAYSISHVASPTQYQILASGLATATVSDGGAVPSYTSTVGSNSVTVTLANHGYSVGSTYAAYLSTSVGGLTIQGLYNVTAVASSSQFTINSQYQATSAQTVSINGGNAGIIYWVTPVQSSLGTGYGDGPYGMGSYGNGVVPPSRTGTLITVDDYCLDNWGSSLIANPQGYGIFVWSPYSGLRGSQLIPTAPTACQGTFVAMPEQQIVAYGASVFGIQDPMLVAFCDNGDYTDWTASTSNQAGTFRLTHGSMIVGGLQGPQQALLWTDVGVWVMQYVGYPLVWGFSEVGQGCGLIAKKAAGVLGESVYWMSQKGFFTYTNGAVVPLPCDVWDVLFQDLNTAYASKIRFAANSQFDEISWFYPSLKDGVSENTRYVKYNVILNCWDTGLMARSAWVDQGALGPPIASGIQVGVSDFNSDFNSDFSPSYGLFQHETQADGGGHALDCYFETGFFMLSEGEEKVFIDYVIPDFKYETYDGTTSATVQMTVYVSDYPWVTPTAYGPYAMTSATKAVSLRARGRFVALKFESDDIGTWWRLGAVRFRFATDGRN